MRTNATELVYKCASADNSEIVHLHFTSQLRAVGHNDIIVQNAIMRDMAVRHNKIIGTDDGLAFRSRAAVDSNELAEDTVVAYDSPGLFAFVF
jgi:hypothetical protein